MKKILQGFLVVVIVALSGVVVWTRFANPGMTETQLFLHFWWQSVGVVAAIILLALLSVDSAGGKK